MKDLFLITHVYNEKLMLEPWIRHHYNIADHIIILDSNTTDDSLEVVKKYPKCQVVKSQIPDFSAWGNTQECMALEAALPEDSYKLILNVTEWVWRPHFKEYIDYKFDKQGHPIGALGMKSIVMVDSGYGYCNDFYDDAYGFVDEKMEHRRWRFVHNARTGQYELGRHGTSLPHMHDQECYILYFAFSPWPQCMERKLQIQTQIPEWDKAAKLGWEHIVTREDLKKRYEQFLAKSHDLREDLEFTIGYDYYSQCDKVEI